MSDLKIFGEHDDQTVAQMWRCMGVGSTVGGVLCADGHLGYAQPVGGVVAYESHISISGVGFDIGCGNLASKTDMVLSDIQPRLDRILKDISKVISFGIGRKNSERVDHDLFDSPLWEDAGVGYLKEMARGQRGTVGSGQDISMLEGVKQHNEDFQRLKNDRQFRNQAKLVSDWAAEAIKIIHFRS